MNQLHLTDDCAKAFYLALKHNVGIALYHMGWNGRWIYGINSSKIGTC